MLITHSLSFMGIISVESDGSNKLYTLPCSDSRIWNGFFSDPPFFHAKIIGSMERGWARSIPLIFLQFQQLLKSCSKVCIFQQRSLVSDQITWLLSNVFRTGTHCGYLGTIGWIEPTSLVCVTKHFADLTFEMNRHVTAGFWMSKSFASFTWET